MEFELTPENARQVLLQTLVDLKASHAALAEVLISLAAPNDEVYEHHRKEYFRLLNERRESFFNEIYANLGALDFNSLFAGTNPQASTNNQEQPAQAQAETTGTANSRGNFWGFLKRSR